jgi:hypothetical protein
MFLQVLITILAWDLGPGDSLQVSDGTIPVNQGVYTTLTGVGKTTPANFVFGKWRTIVSVCVFRRYASDVGDGALLVRPRGPQHQGRRRPRLPRQLGRPARGAGE